MLSAPLSLEAKAEALTRVNPIYFLALDDVGGLQELECAIEVAAIARGWMLSAEVVATVLYTLRLVTKNEPLQRRLHKSLHPSAI